MRKYLEHVTALLPLVGALLLSYNIMEGFYVFLSASSISILYFHLTKQKWMLIQSLLFTLININGVYIHFIK